MHRQLDFLRCKCVLFDMDGTLLDSRAPMHRAYTEWANRYGLDPSLVIRAAQGRRTIDTLWALAPAGTDVEADTVALMQREYEDTEGIVEIPGAGELLRALPPHRWAVVTSADRALAQRRLAAAGLPAPHLLISAEDVVRGKPAPDGFELAARRMEFDARHSVVFEDAPAGIEAGIAAGAKVVAVGFASAAQGLGEAVRVHDLRGIRAPMDGDDILLQVTA
ncbi:HAD-IA family hydrolase [Paraburkholderia sp. 2C]|jgi:mannitol-1-/sugar-/sorbitol-6-phosphatase